MQELAINKPYRHLTVGYVRKRHEDRNTKIPKRYSVHAALSLKGDWLEKAGFTTHSRVRVGVEPLSRSKRFIFKEMDIITP